MGQPGTPGSPGCSSCGCGLGPQPLGGELVLCMTRMSLHTGSCLRKGHLIVGVSHVAAVGTRPCGRTHGRARVCAWGKSMSAWPQDEGGHVRNCSEVPELPGAGVRGAAFRRARHVAGRPRALEQGGGAGSTLREGRPLIAPGAQPGSGWNPGASGLLLWVFGIS